LTDWKKLPALKVMIGAVMISFSGVYVKLAHVTPTVAGFYRVFLGGVILMLIMIWKRERLWKGFPCFALGILCGFIFALDLLFWHKSIHYIGPGLATILANFQVFLLALFGVTVLGEKMNLRLILAIPLAMIGLFMIVGIRWDHMGESYRLGILLGLATAICYCGYVLTLRKLQSMNDPLSPMANLMIITFATSVFLGIGVWQEGASFMLPDAQTIVVLFSYGLFSQVIGWILISTGLPGIRASLAGLLLLLQPALAFVWDMLFFNKETTSVSIAGAILTIAAIYMGTARRTDKGKDRKPPSHKSAVNATVKS